MILNTSLQMNVTETSSPRLDTKSQYLYKKRKRIPVFPQRLYDMLERAEERGYSHIFSWMPDGKSFKIHVSGSRSAASERTLVQVLKSNNFQQTKFRSFLRQLNQYGFERTQKGKGEFRHEFFVRGKRGLLEGKSIDDFQQPQDYISDEEENKQNKTFDPLLRLSSHDNSSLFLESDRANYWKPASTNMIPTNGILQVAPWQSRSSMIPMTLNNLDRSKLQNRKHRDVFCRFPSSQTNGFKLNHSSFSSNEWKDDDTIPTIGSCSDDDDFDDWMNSSLDTTFLQEQETCNRFEFSF